MKVSKRIEKPSIVEWSEIFLENWSISRYVKSKNFNPYVLLDASKYLQEKMYLLSVKSIGNYEGVF